MIGKVRRECRLYVYSPQKIEMPRSCLIEKMYLNSFWYLLLLLKSTLAIQSMIDVC